MRLFLKVQKYTNTDIDSEKDQAEVYLKYSIIGLGGLHNAKKPSWGMGKVRGQWESSISSDSGDVWHLRVAFNHGIS